MQLGLLLQRFRAFPECLGTLSLSQIEGFISLARHLRYRISLLPCTTAVPPAALPRSVHSFICAATNIDYEDAKICWEVLKDHIWSLPEQEAHPAVYLDSFLQHGIAHGIGFRDIYPPTRTCLNPICQIVDPQTGDVRGRSLSGKESTYPAVLFSHDLGPIPVWSTSWECRDCGARYYNNYYVPKGSPHAQRTRTYYGGCPAIIEVTEKVFVTDRLCEWVCNQMVCAWVSSTNNARIYSLSHAAPDCQWPVKFELEPAHVWDAFYIYSLLLQHSEEGRTLSLPDQAASNSERLKSALEARNLQMTGPGQELWSHACDLCCKNIRQPDGSTKHIRSLVTDGITMGHPTCAMHNCQNPLPTTRARFCGDHQALESICAARDDGVPCTQPCERGFRTCARESHRKLESGYRMQGQAMFQLRKRLEKLSVMQTTSSIPAAVNTSPEDGNGHVSDVEVDYEDVCEGKPETGNRKLRAKFGRSRTHNEELCVASCGIIVGRATFFGSEAVKDVIQFWKGLFPTKKSLPMVLWHDNNCNVQKSLRHANDHYLDDVALPVDVFHFKCKHKEGDVFCGQHCNPLLWPELLENGKWRFNSSAAEQTNAWMGGFRAIVREMRRERYCFFLDEMIKRHNRILVGSLYAKGAKPWMIPRDVLLS